MFNPDLKYVQSKGIDRPIMYVYLAGRIAGNCIDKCLAWRHQIIDHYSNYKGKGAYPISFLDALNSKESDSIDKLGLKSAIPPNLIYDKDLLSVERADVVVANMGDYMEEGLDYHMRLNKQIEYTQEGLDHDYKKLFFDLQKTIKERRPNWGTNCEVSWALKDNKPLILIASNEYQKNMLEQHPFMKRASVIVSSVDELLEKKWLNILYKSIAGAIY